MTHVRRSILWLRPGLFVAALLSSVFPARAEYSLQAGDVVEISVAGIPELKQRVPVQLDGSITVPLVGTLMVEGAPFSEIRSKIQSAVASKVFRLRTPDGRDLPRMFEREEVAATIVEYKPVFVTGDVTRPNEQPFRPRMTVRQAIATAGGLVTQGRGSITSSDAPSLRSEYVTVWLSLAKEYARVWRIKSEIGEKVDFDQRALPPSPVPDATVKQILNLEVDYRTIQQSDHERAKNHFLRLLLLADEQMKVLSEQQIKEEQGVLADTQELARVTELFGRGMMTSLRVTDARRAVLLSSTRQLQTASQLMSVKKSRAEFARELEKTDDQRRSRMVTELQEAIIKLAGERAKLQSAEEKLNLAGVRLPRASETSGQFDMVVFRKGANASERINADADTELRPGDVLEIALRSEQVELAGPQTSLAEKR